MFRLGKQYIINPSICMRRRQKGLVESVLFQQRPQHTNAFFMQIVHYLVLAVGAIKNIN